MNYEEAASWTVEEVRHQIGLILPDEWAVEYDTTDDGFYTYSFKDRLGVVRWQDAHPDERHLLLCAYGWLVSQEKRPVNPFWGQRRELTPALVRQHAVFKSANTPDPEDLTPDEVLAVYEKQGS